MTKELDVEFHLECGCSECEELQFATANAQRMAEALGRVTVKVKNWRYTWLDYKDEVVKRVHDWGTHYRKLEKQEVTSDPNLAAEYALFADAFEAAVTLLADEVWDIRDEGDA